MRRIFFLHEQRPDRGLPVQGAVAVLPAHVRQHHLPAAVQHCRQPRCRQVHRRECTGCCGQQLRDHPDLSGVLIRLQHRRLCHRFPVLRRKRLQHHENRRLHGAHRHGGALRCPDGGGPAGLPEPAGAHPHPGGADGRLGRVSGHLHPGAALPVPLQCGNGHFYGAGRQPHPVPVSGGFLHGKHRGGRVVCGCL